MTKKKKALKYLNAFLQKRITIMNSEKIKYLAYKELGFSPYEHKYFDELLEQIVKVRGLSDEDNPIHKSKNYENVEALIGNINNFLQKYALRAGERIDIKPPEMTEENILAFEKFSTICK